jgi:hypothetical protein
VRIQGGPILEHLIPLLTQDPISTSKAKTLSSLASVAGDMLNPYMNTVLRSLLIVIETVDYNSHEGSIIQKSISELFSSISHGSIDSFLEYVLHYLTTARSACGIRRVSEALVSFFSNQVIDYDEYIDSIFETVFPLFIQESENVYIAAWDVLYTWITSRIIFQSLESAF